MLPTYRSKSTKRSQKKKTTSRQRNGCNCQLDSWVKTTALYCFALKFEADELVLSSAEVKNHTHIVPGSTDGCTIRVRDLESLGCSSRIKYGKSQIVD